MASVMDRQSAETRAPQSQGQPRPVARPGADDIPAILTDRIPGKVAALVAAAWVVGVPVAYALEPTAQTTTVSWYVNLLSVALVWSGGAMLAGLILRKRFGLLASAASAGIFTIASIMCPVSGHHTWGVWWLGQMAISLALVGLSLVTFRLTRPATR